MLYSAARRLASSPGPGGTVCALRASACLMLVVVALVDIRFWFRSPTRSTASAFVLLVAVEMLGDIGMGAQRWLDLGLIQLQPSELMKVALVLALARYFHGA